MAVTTMGAGDKVIVSQDRDGTHSHRFLTGVQVRSPLDQVTSQQIVHLVLEQADLPHLLQEIESPFLCKVDVPSHG
jgi:hypothetical protein